MAQLRRVHGKFVARDVQVVVMGPEGAAAYAAYFEREALPFVGLPDPGASVLKLYGQEVNLLKLGRMPAQVWVDKTGVARFVPYGHSMSDIPPMRDPDPFGPDDGLRARRRCEPHSPRGEAPDGGAPGTLGMFISGLLATQP